MFALTSFKTISKTLVTVSAVFALSGCIIHVGGGSNDTSEGNSVSSVFGGLEVSKGKHVSNVSSVNGGIELHDDVTARTVDTVNGSIEMGEYVEVQNASTVNGDIQAGHHFTSAGYVKTVNGDISLMPNSKLGQDVETVNGDIQLQNVSVNGSVHTHNGDIKLTNNTQILGDIIFHQNNRNNKGHSIPKLNIEMGVTVSGQIILYREVDLNIEDAELLKKVEIQYDNEK
ncbi:DUF4097 family beta strand repeat-containing protein [Aliiglaciecola lipolytica]|uniref:DUF4097 domain-containing protein n=1 Tax=Aliiglaciecola lipolytica E3 TaxID=1127673 RepID=K6X1Z5_9ALTE|nr:DUF4097 family beta strand repeat-containing protein [Aliiglaciecola lipolytica]GAC14684.1 hypothetical protein GLIP_2056 [Aliiglaciecola lipolytica E3]